MRERKALTGGLTLDPTKEGSFRAAIASLNVIDHDDDVTIPGAFKAGQPVRVAQAGHNWGLPTIGGGKIVTDAAKAYIQGEFNLKMTAGREHYESVKWDAEHDKLQEWSYGYDVVDSEMGQFEGKDVRFLKALDVIEVSQVMLGAGIGTGTENVKTAKDAFGVGPIRKRLAQLRAKQLQADPDTLATIAQIDLLIDQADELVDTLMDDAGIPDPDETEPEEVLEPGALGAASLVGPKGLTFATHAKNIGLYVGGFTKRAKALAALRAKEGRTLSTENRGRLTSLVDSMRTGLADVEKLLADTSPAIDPGKADLARLRLLEMRREAATLGVFAHR